MTPTLVTLGDLVPDLIVPIDELPLRAQQHQIAHDMTIEAGSTDSVLIVSWLDVGTPSWPTLTPTSSAIRLFTVHFDTTAAMSSSTCGDQRKRARLARISVRRCSGRTVASDLAGRSSDRRRADS